MPGPPLLTLTLEVRALVGAPVDIGEVPGGRRRIVPIVGGTFEGHGELDIKGRVLPGGVDSQLIHADGLTVAHAQYTLESGRGALVYVKNRGLRHAPPDIMQKLLAGERVDPSRVYFRTAPAFETAAPELQLLTHSIFVGDGERYPDEVVLRFWKVN